MKENLKQLTTKWLFRKGTLLGCVCEHSLPDFKRTAHPCLRLKSDQCSGWFACGQEQNCRFVAVV